MNKDFWKSIFGGASAESRADAKTALDESEHEESEQTGASDADDLIGKVPPQSGPSIPAQLSGMEKLMGDMLKALGGVDARLKALEAPAASSAEVVEAEVVEEATLPDASDKWAASLVTAGTILPMMAESYANVHRTLSRLEGAAKEAGAEASVTLLTADGKKTGILETFVLSVGPVASRSEQQSNGWLNSFAVQSAVKGGKVVQTRTKTDDKTADGLRVMDDDEIGTMMDRIMPKKTAKSGA